ncbi:hypothetical protein GH5_05382 [Leishmania sp. Ghana 2012 LV757]|uniref:hypothetical protein n=1 Tax=Leishmania sp. Ghana 2012 LV757 TaxID=2803181 RepID=UPI001B762363|nr:hypothetical protein GH5_05382 [Leishmania sp. Ghana 2012 LV757]
MDDSSFLSGLSSINEAIRDTAYGRCISILVTSCEPSFDELAVRLGGPGCPWEIARLPMQRPVVLHRHPGVRVARRATELAFATKAYAESPAADTNDVHPSGSMVAMDILTSTAISAAASTLTTSAVPAATGDSPVTELTATKQMLDGTSDAEGGGGASQPPLRVCFCWAIGEVLPGHTPQAGDAAKTGEGNGAEDERKAHFRDDEKTENEDSRECDAPLPRTSATLGGEAITPFSSGKLSAISCSAQLAFAGFDAVPEEEDGGCLAAIEETSARAASANNNRRDKGTTPCKNGAMIAAGGQGEHRSSNGGVTRGEVPTATAPPAETGAGTAHEEKAVAQHGSGSEEAATGVSERFLSPIVVNPFSTHDDAVTAAVKLMTDSAADSSGAHALKKDIQSPASAAILGGPSSPIRCKSPRRRRPHHYRCGTIDMAMTPVMTPPQQEADGRDVTAEVPVQVSEDDNEDRGNVASTVIRSPPPPQAAGTLRHQVGHAAPHALAPALDSNTETTIRLSNEAESSYNTTVKPPSSNGAGDGTLDRQRQAAPVPKKYEGTSVVVKASAVPRPTAGNLFKGVDGAALIVVVGVVSIYNANGTADPHRIVSAEISATTLEKEGTTHDCALHTTAFSFRTAPTLRGLAAVVPQVSSPLLLLSRCQNGAKGTASDYAGAAVAVLATPPTLRVSCTVTEHIAFTEEGISSDCASTTLWTSIADVALDQRLLSPSASSPAPAPPTTHEVRFTGANGDGVLTLWTYMTVGAYRDAVLNLRSRVAATGAPPVLQMLLVEESPVRTDKPNTSRHPKPSTATVWVSSPSSSDSERVDSIVHRVVAVSPAHDIMQQPVSVPVRNPLAYVAVQLFSSSSVASHAQLVFSYMLSDAWTRSTPVACDGDARAASTSVTAVLYYRFVDASTSVASAKLPTLPTPRLEGSRALNNSNEAAELREITITVHPPATFLGPLLSSTSSYADAGKSDAVPQSASSWHLVLCHAVTHVILAEASPATGVLTYRSFLPVLSGGRKASGKRGAQAAVGTAGTASIVTASVGEMGFLPWEVLLFPSSGSPKQSCGASLPSKRGAGAIRPITRSPAHTTQTRGESSLASQRVETAADTNAWSGPIWISCSALYSAPSTGTHWKTSICVSSAPVSLTATMSMLRSPPAALGAQLEVNCAIRTHVLGTDSAVFSLRSLRLVPSSVTGGAPAPPAGASPLPPSQVQLWFTTSGSSAEEVRAAWSSADVPSAKKLQRAWAPAVPESSNSCTLPLRIGADGQMACTSGPVLLSTTNARARLCVALATAAETTTLSDSRANARALRRCVTTVRRNAIHRYKKAHATLSTEQDSKETESQRQTRWQLTEEQMADVFVQCVNAVAMGVENYAEVDLSPSLVAASERPGERRHRLLLSFVSGTIRMSHHLLLELHGQWIKMPRWVPVVSEGYTPSPRLWALRRSCIVRRPDAPLRTAGSLMDVSDGAQLAQEVLRAHMGYDMVVQSVPLDYTDPSERAVETLLPGLSYDKLVVQTKQREARLQPYCEVIRIASPQPAAASRWRGGHAALVAEGGAINDDDIRFEDSEELLEHIFSPTGLAHAAYVSEASRKVAVVHFFFGDAYTTRTALSVSCTASVAAKDVTTSVQAQPYGSGDDPPPLFPGESTQLIPKSIVGSTASSTYSAQVLCDSLTRTSTLFSVLPVSAMASGLPGESHHRYPSELTWYHGNLTIEVEEEKRRLEEGEATWRRGLTEQQLGVHQKPGPLVVSAVTQHPHDCLPLVVEPSLTRCADGRHYIVFGGISTATGAASSSVYAFDDAEQMWQPLRARRSACGMVLSSTTAAVPPPRYGHTAVYRPADGAIYVFGGRGRCDDTAAAPVYGDVWRMFWNVNTSTVAATELHCTWADMPSAATGGSKSGVSSMVTGDFDDELARWRHAAVLHNDYIMVIGGQSSTGACCSCAKVLYLDIMTQEWTARRSFGTEVPCPRYGLAATVASEGTALYIFGGWGQEQSSAGNLLSGVHLDSSFSSDADSGAADADEEQSVVALSDFFKMDLITRVWSRVVPNGTVRPPALELADMTSCILDDCPVILLVGGRTNGGVVATPTTERTAGAQLMVFLFSTATLFWRMVRMDCTPVATRFGLRAVASETSVKGLGSGKNVRYGQRTEASCLRRALPPRGSHIGSILVVGGLPLEEVDAAQTAPAISILLAAGNGSFTASRRATTASHATRRTLHSQQGLLAPWPPTVPRAAPMRRPMIGPARTLRLKSYSTLSGSCRSPAIASDWLQASQSTCAGGEGNYECDRSAEALAVSATSAATIHQSMERLRTPTSASGRAATPLSSPHLSCYSTLTPWQQRRLVRRLYTKGIEIRDAHRQQLQDEVHEELSAHAFRSNKSRKRSPGARRSPMPARHFSTPLHRLPYDAAATKNESLTASTTLGAMDSNRGNGALIHSAAIPCVPLAHRDLQNAFLARGSSSSSRSSSLMTHSSSSSSISNSSDSEQRAEVVEPPRADASLTDLPGVYDRTNSRCAKEVENEDVRVDVSEAETPVPERAKTVAGVAAASQSNTGEDAEAAAAAAMTEKEFVTSESREETGDHFEEAPSHTFAAVLRSTNAVVMATPPPVPIPVAVTHSRKEKVINREDDVPVAASGPSYAREVTPAAEVEEEEPHRIEQQAPDVPAPPLVASQSSSSAASSKSFSHPPAPLAASAANGNAAAKCKAAAAVPRPPEDGIAVAGPLSFVYSIPTVDHQDEVDKDDAVDDPEEESDDWETDSDVSAPAVTAAPDEPLEDLTPPPAPREHATPPSSPSVLLSPPPEEARSGSEVTKHEMSSVRETESAGAAAERSLEAATASSPASSMADTPIAASPAMEAPAAPFSPHQRLHAGDYGDDSKVLSSPEVEAWHVAAEEEDGESEAALRVLQHDADAAVEQPFATPPAPLDASTTALEPAAAPSAPSWTAPADVNHVDARGGAEASNEESEDVADADATPVPHQPPTALSASPRTLSKVPEALLAVLSSHVSSISSEYMDGEHAAAASSPEHEEGGEEAEKNEDASVLAEEEGEGQYDASVVEASQRAEKLHNDSDLGEPSGVQDDAEEIDLAAAVAPVAADVNEEAPAPSSAALKASPHVGESKEEELEEAPAASADLSSVEDAAVAEQAVSAFTSPSHRETPDNWSELSSAAEDANDRDNTHTLSEERVEEAIVDLNGGRDLLDRRRGVEEALQDDDFDF